MTEQTPVPNRAIEQYLNLALEGSKDAARQFFEAFLEGPLFVPERHQHMPLSNSPQYPNDFMTVLGVQDKERVVIPAFSEPQFIEEWCGEKFTFRTMKGSDLLKIVPEDWWLCVNPGRETEKEFTPWEINELKLGPESIPVILDELFQESARGEIEVAPVEDTEFEPLRAALIEAAQIRPDIRRLFLLKEIRETLEGDPETTLLLGVDPETDENLNIHELQTHFHSVADSIQIGAEPVKVIVRGDASESLLFGVFQGAEPLYSKKVAKKGFAQKVAALFKK